MLAGIFLFAAFTKLPDPSAFAKNIEAYQLTPYKANHFIALFIPALEIVLSLALFTSYFSKASLYLFTMLTTTFLIALTTAWATNKDIDCGCFGGNSKVNGFKIIMDIALLLFIMAVLWLQNQLSSNSQINPKKELV